MAQKLGCQTGDLLAVRILVGDHVLQVQIEYRHSNSSALIYLVGTRLPATIADDLSPFSIRKSAPLSGPGRHTRHPQPSQRCVMEKELGAQRLGHARCRPHWSNCRRANRDKQNLQGRSAERQTLFGSTKRISHTRL